jgi:hypothetical protein
MALEGRNDGTFEEELQRGPLVSNWRDMERLPR